MLNHITLCVKDLEKSKRFYAAALKPLGYELYVEGRVVGFGTKDCEGWRDLWLKQQSANEPQRSFSCLAFTASSKQQVNDFYRAALAAGGTDNGQPGYRPEYYRTYAKRPFLCTLGPGGYNIEAVFDDVTRLDQHTGVESSD